MSTLFMRKIIQNILKHLTRRIIKKYQPEVIGITGSVGKTSAKQAILAVLSPDFNTRASINNYNNELGLPLTVIGVNSPGKSIWGWLGVIIRGFKLILIYDANYPEVLVLEMGADKPGDIKYLADIVRPRIGVVTAVSPVHLENFGSVAEVEREKRRLVSGLAKEDFAILNLDNELAAKMRVKTKAQVLGFGINFASNITIKETFISYEEGKLRGMSAKIGYKGSVVPVFLPGILGNNHIYAAAAGVAVGATFNINLVELAQRMKDYRAPRGRMRLLAGIKNTTLIDDTYNSSPLAVKSALEILTKIISESYPRKIVILGDMLELGKTSQKEHLEIGRLVKKSGINILITVGNEAQNIANGALEVKMPKKNIFTFVSVEDAGKYLQKIMLEGDLVLIKGSQVSRMEKVVKEVMAEPLRAGELLVRQGKEWER